VKIRRFRRSVLLFLLIASSCILVSGCAQKRRAVREEAPAAPELPARTFRIAIVLDDAGNTRECLSTVEETTFPVTIAVLPSVAYTRRFASVASPQVRKIVHLPMEASKLDPGPDTVRTSMTDEELMKTLEVIFSQVPDAAGFNNHMGSVFMKDGRAMRVVFTFAAQRKLFFLNSLTSKEKTAEALSLELSVPYIERDVFLDNTKDAKAIKLQFEDCLRVAREHGACVAQGHVRPLTLQVLSELVPRAERAGYTFVFLEDILSKH
jgi:uncharacterized protein